jgi:hypothetical protein
MSITEVIRKRDERDMNKYIVHEGLRRRNKQVTCVGILHRRE